MCGKRLLKRTVNFHIRIEDIRAIQGLKVVMRPTLLNRSFEKDTRVEPVVFEQRVQIIWPHMILNCDMRKKRIEHYLFFVMKKCHKHLLSVFNLWI